MDILSIDKIIRENLLYKDKKQKLIKSINVFKKVLKDLIFDEYIKRCEKQLEENIEKLKCIEEKEDLKFYLMKSTPILERYKILLSKPIFLSFKNEKQNSEKRDLIKEYLEVAREYTNIPKIIEKQIKQCENCGGKDFEKEEDFNTCKNCFCISFNYFNIHSFNDINRVNIRK